MGVESTAQDDRNPDEELDDDEDDGTESTWSEESEKPPPLEEWKVSFAKATQGNGADTWRYFEAAGVHLRKKYRHNPFSYIRRREGLTF